ncbi:hypothetical protein EXU57_03845 [Segetibacter sp. 3557_3]|uniref:sensor histidine kinase n=1 Tax=Segetibacter sp. 3557_3 TaxID=2547429 RepID=UPI0010588021|nr:sensor histidine kinase [Segetibacter sp. 3557_3]TDH29209.1 hypothetical protein EXU57_03845 [Segetibacter sp. 3557_3]
MRLFIALMFLAIGGLASAQSQQPYLFSHLGSRNGLAADDVVAVQQDAKGYLWIATLNGLQRYDGHRFITFQHSSSRPFSIASDEIRAMKFDGRNRLWLLAGDNNIGYLNTIDYTYHEVPVRWRNGKALHTDGHLAADSNGHIMLILDRLGLYTYNDKQGAFTTDNPFQIPFNWEVREFVHVKKQQVYWIACDSGLVKYDAARRMVISRLNNPANDPVINAFAGLRHLTHPFHDNTGRFWIYSWGPSGPGPYLYSFDPHTKKVMEWEAQLLQKLKYVYHEVAGIREIAGKLYVYGGSVFATFNGKKETFEIIPGNLSGDFAMRYNGVRDLFTDRESNVWVSTDKGLYYFNPSAQFFHTIVNKRPGKDSAFTPDVTGILQTGSNEILVSTWGSGLFAYDSLFQPVKKDFVQRSLQLGEGMPWCIYKNHNGDIWRGNQDGYLFISRSNGTSEKLQPPVFEKRTIRQIAGDLNGNLWFGTQGGHLVKYTTATNQFSLAHRFGSKILRLFTDKQGIMWVCTSASGVLKVNPVSAEVSESFTVKGPENSRLSSAGATDIIQFNDSIYIIAGSGLIILNDRTNRTATLTREDGLPSNNVSNIIKDRQGYIWVTTANGLCSIKMGDEIIVTSYNEKDGIKPNAYNPGAAVMLNDGRIAIGTSHDLVVFKPGKMMQGGGKPPAVHVTGFSVMGKWLPVDSLSRLRNIELPNDKNAVIVEFSTFSYLNEYSIEYMMENLDKEWNVAGETFQAVYNYLPPGSYTFRIRCSDGEGNYSGQVTALKIKVKPPFWATYWFVSLLALTFVGVLYWFDKFRISRIRETARVRANIANSLTRDMSSTLTNINMLSELAKVKAETDLVRTKEYVSQISESSYRMMEVMDDMVWSIHPENDEMKHTISRMKKYAGQIQSKYHVEVAINIGDPVKRIRLDMHSRHELFLIFKEVLLNAGKHAECRFVDVDLHCETGKLVLKILDDGKGFDVEMVSFGRGLNEIRKRATSLKGKLDIHSEINTGTVVRLVIPI